MVTLGHPYATTADSVKLSITTSEPFNLLSQTASWICFHSCCHSGRKSCMKTWQTAGLGFQNAAKDLSAILKDTKFDSTAFFPESCNLTVALYSNLPQSCEMEARFRFQLILALSVLFLVLLISFHNYDGPEVDCQPIIKVPFLVGSSGEKSQRQARLATWRRLWRKKKTARK